MSKLRTLAGLKTIVARERRKGRRVVLANGGFDLLHVGHIRYLEAAARLGKILIVALNSDASLRRLKGPGRPLLPQAERAAILSGMACVDHVVIFDEPNVERILLALKPDVHAKGSDYSKKTVPERAVVLGYGGRIAIVGGAKVRSTSEVIPRVLHRLRAKKASGRAR
ncbi:MAG: adenylyltransferase/cytidyltransferase family protein [Candidatus Aminicenantes bacterium]|nr:adenylyltransferase/cytidyltransferase family protein [Candidatus Aminicenantes bacterium]